MKIQDIFFIIVLLLLIYKKDSKLFLICGLGSILLSIPLFYLQIFFTAQHLIWYAWAFLVGAVIVMLIKEKKV